MLIERFEKGAAEAGKDPSTMPKMIQVKVSLADTDQEAIDQAVKDWPNGGMAFPKGDIRNPEDFEIMAKMVEGKHFKNRVLTTADIDKHVEYLQHFIDLGFDEVYVHNVNRNQEAFIKAYGKMVIPKLRWGNEQAVGRQHAAGR
jgi:alkanesulfonate monooxygenase SsuD/methylene tetrahydromethanopterin reductase-like flavin-dependent oxidoreductase (luciferase family)